jgi:hypothetical protein
MIDSMEWKFKLAIAIVVAVLLGAAVMLGYGWVGIKNLVRRRRNKNG